MTTTIPYSQARDKIDRVIQDDTRKGVEGVSSEATRPFSVNSGAATNTETCTAKVGELCLVDPTAGGLTVYLQKITPGDVGKHFLIKNHSNSANTVTIRGSDADIRIDGSVTVTITASRGVAELMIVSITEVIRLSWR